MSGKFRRFCNASYQWGIGPYGLLVGSSLANGEDCSRRRYGAVLQPSDFSNSCVAWGFRDCSVDSPWCTSILHSRPEALHFRAYTIPYLAKLGPVYDKFLSQLLVCRYIQVLRSVPRFGLILAPRLFFGFVSIRVSRCRLVYQCRSAYPGIQVSRLQLGLRFTIFVLLFLGPSYIFFFKRLDRTQDRPLFCVKSIALFREIYSRQILILLRFSMDREHI